MVDVVRCDRPSGQAGPMPGRATRTRLECPWCGPFYRQASDTVGVCPTCLLTPGEVRYSERIIADSDAVWREENRAFQALRTANKTKEHQ